VRRRGEPAFGVALRRTGRFVSVFGSERPRCRCASSCAAPRVLLAAEAERHGCSFGNAGILAAQGVVPTALPGLLRFVAAGHGHLGLTGAPRTGRLIAALVTGEPPGLAVERYAPDRFENGALEEPR